jgi:hypothetical protein
LNWAIFLFHSFFPSPYKFTILNNKMILDSLLRVFKISELVSLVWYRNLPLEF